MADRPPGARPAAGPVRFVLAHGFTQTARSWSTVERLLLERFTDAEVVAVDLLGHGSAGTLRGDLWDNARRLVDEGGPGVHVGYSMGGRVALHAALQSPRAVERMVLIGATAGIVDPGERAARRAADEALAERIEEIGVEAFVDEWLTTPLFAGLTPLTARRDDRLRNTPSGLAGSLRTAGTGAQEPLWDRLGEIGVPVLVVAGEHDPKFREIGRRLADAIPTATFAVVADAGHSVHLEQPVATVATIAAWLDAA